MTTGSDQHTTRCSYDDEVKEIKKSMAFSIASVLAVAAAAVLLPVPDILVAPVILGTAWITGRVMKRRLTRRLDALDAKTLEGRR